MNRDKSPYSPPQAEISDPAFTHELAGPYDLPGSPLSVAGMSLLLFKPRRFFSDRAWLLKTPELVLVAWICGVTATMERVDSRLMRADFGMSSNQDVLSWLTSSWLNYWLFTIGLGALSAGIIWYVGGWWYRLRLRWSGAHDVEPMDARTVNIYQTFVQSAPVIVFTLILMTKYTDYAQYWVTEDAWSVFLIVFVFWSCWISYKAARSFTVVTWKARIWFLALPLVFYASALGLIAALFIWLESQAL